MPVPIRITAQEIDLSSRIVDTVAITGSPATNEEAIVATLVLPSFGDAAVTQKIYLSGWVALTIGTSGTAMTVRLRQTNAAGALVKSSGALTGGITAANLVAQDIDGSDATPGVGTYVMTVQITGGAAASTVSSVSLRAFVV
jgi:hypothetical protein